MLKHSQGVCRGFEIVHPVRVFVRTESTGGNAQRLEETIPVGIEFLFGDIIIGTVSRTGENRIAIDIGQVACRIDRLCRIFIQIRSCDTGLVLIIDIHTLRIDIEGQMVIQERGVEVERSSHTLHLRTLNRTVIEGITHGCTIRHIHILILETSGEGDVMVGRDSGTIALLEPVHIIIHEVSIRLTRLS